MTTGQGGHSDPPMEETFRNPRVSGEDGHHHPERIGVLAFELLSGKLPYDLKRRSIPEALDTKMGSADRWTKEQISGLVDLYSACDKPEKAAEWRKKLALEN